MKKSEKHSGVFVILLAEAVTEPSAIREAGAEVSKIEDAASALKIFS